MRADRLLAILLLLQRERRMTAGDLARRLEVSERTIYRDLEALGAAGVPVYAEPGRNGGIRLLEGYTTDLSGLSLNEAELVQLLGLSDILAGFGVGPSIRQTEQKVLAALPEDQRRRAEQSRRRLYVDLSRWWDSAENIPHLTTVVEAVFAGRRLRMTYRGGGDDAKEVKRTLDPLGIVVQGGTWYLVALPRPQGARQQGEPRIYRVSRIRAAEALDEHFDYPNDFDLGAFWAARKEDFHITRTGYRVRVRVRRNVVHRLLHDPGQPLPEIEDEDGDWLTTSVHMETRWIAFDRLMAMGASVEVIEPDELRAGMSEAIQQMSELYAR